MKHSCTEEQSMIIMAAEKSRPTEEYTKGVEEQQNENASLWADTTLWQKLLIVFVMTGNFTIFSCTSAPSPFLARVVLEKGGSLEVSAIILQVTLLTMALSSIVFGNFQPVLGCKRLFVGGLALFSLCQIAFAFLDYISNIVVFVAVGTILKGLQGIGDGAFVVSALTLVCQEFPKHIRQVFGFSEAAVGAGMVIGPVLGGPLYDIGGMLLPFVVSGVFTLLLVPLAAILMRKVSVEIKAEEKFRMSNLLWNVKALLILGGMGSTLGGFALCDAILTTYLETRGFTATEAGFVFFTLGISYCVGCALVGYITSFREWLSKIVMVVGYVGCVFIGLVYSSNQSKVWIYVGVMCVGLLVAASFVPSFNELLRAAGKGSDASETNFAMHSAVSGAWNFILGVASFVLSLVGSALVKVFQHFSLALVSSISIGYLFTILFSGTILLVKKCRRRTARERNLSVPNL